MKDTVSYACYLKSPYKSVKHSTYFEVYDNLFSRYRDKEITFVEIGVLGGGSLFMWRNFFGPKARIIGIDLNPNAKKWEDEGFEIYIGSQSDLNFWRDFINEVGSIDVVLDDGGHTYLQQIVTTETLLGLINDHGMLVVEDTHTSYMNGFGAKRYSFVEYTKQLIDRINFRFGDLEKDRADKRVWSIQCFESIVAFHVNRPASTLLSEPTSNEGDDDSAKDFRNHGQQPLRQKTKYRHIFRFFASIPGVRSLGVLVRESFHNRTDSARRLREYF